MTLKNIDNHLELVKGFNCMYPHVGGLEHVLLSII